MRIQFLARNMALFLFPMLAPLLILGSLSIFITSRYTENEITRNNVNLFYQLDRNMDLIFYELDSLYVHFNNPEMLFSLKNVLRTPSKNLDTLQTLRSINNYVVTPIYSKPYIYSIYAYVENDYKRFYTSVEQDVVLMSADDTEWFDTYLAHKSDDEDFLTGTRKIQRYAFEKPVPIVSVYKKMYVNSVSEASGVIALNLRKSFFENLLDKICTYPNQGIVVLDEHDRVLFQSNVFRSNDWNPQIFMQNSKNPNQLEINGVSYVVANFVSNKHGWRYVSVIPKYNLYSVSSRLSNLTVFLVVLSFGLSLVLAFYLTRKNLRHIQSMISIIKSAETGLPILTPKIKEDEYGYIINNIIKTFIEQNYLKVQLSEKKYRLEVAELHALQSQINPHFLFNILESIYWKALRLTGSPNDVNAMLEKLSDILKYSLDVPDKIVTLKKEIEYTKSYIDIQRILDENKFDVVWEYDEEIVQTHGILKLTLQPLVENCICHGFKEKEQNCRIKIKILKIDDGIRISVVDNGAGIPKWQLANIRKNLRENGGGPEHIGLNNTSKRFKLMYGENYGIQIRSTYGRGTCAYMNLP